MRLVVAIGASEHEHRVDDDGAPVVPVRDEAELAALRALAERFGAEIVEAQGRVAEPFAGEELVLAVGERSMAAAHVYARLTGRRVACVDAIASWRGVRPSVVVAHPSDVHPLALEALYDPELPGPAPGIVWGRDADELALRVKLAAASAVLQLPARPDVAFVNPDAPMGLRRDGLRTMAGRETPPPLVRELLDAGTGAVAIVTHSDGVDGGLGAQLLCPMDRVRADADPGRAPRCATTGVCHRLRRPVAEVVGSRDVVSPDDLSAAILVWGACFGVMAPDGPVDPAWGLADRLLASPRIGVVVTAWEASFVLPPLVLALVEMLERGLEVGEAVARSNRSALARSRRFRLCVLGDPRVRLTAARMEIADPVATSITVPERVIERRDDDLEQLGFLRYLYGITAPRGPDVPPAIADGWAQAMRAVQDAELAWLQGRSREAEPTLHRTVLADLVQRGPLLYHGWIRSAHVEAEADAVSCPACRHPHHRATRFVASFRAGVVPPRRVSFCPACSVTEDAPLASDLALGFRDGAFELTGDRPRERWSAALVIVEQGQIARHTLPWPADEEGRPVARLVPPEPLPAGPFDAVLVLLHRTRLTMLVQKTRAPAPG